MKNHHEIQPEIISNHRWAFLVVRQVTLKVPVDFIRDMADWRQTPRKGWILVVQNTKRWWFHGIS